MRFEEVKTEIIESLAAKRKVDADELRQELAAAGPDFPYASVWLVSAGARAARKLGIEIKEARRNRNAFKSVDALSRYLFGLAQKQAA
jgi:ribosomal protein L13E